jgi:hypothetical protein
MDIKWDAPRRKGWVDNPAIYVNVVDIPEQIKIPTDDELRLVFGAKDFNKNKRLKTWGRSKDLSGKKILTGDPHFIGVRNGTPLHFDPSYPRYSHHLKIRVDGEIYVRGLDKQETRLTRGVFYILDTHSPHQVLNKAKGDAWNVAISIDSHERMHPQTAINMCLKYGLKANFITGE